MTTITMPRRLVRPVRTRPARRGVLLGFFGTLLAAVIIVAGLTAGLSVAWGSSVLPGVTVGGISLAGLDRSEANRRLEERLPSVSSGAVTLVAGERSAQVSFADLGRRWDVERMVSAALGVGRGENPLADALVRLRALVQPTTLPVVVHPYDADALQRIAADVAAALSTEPVSSVVSSDGSGFAASIARPGRMVEASAVASALATAADSSGPPDARLRLEPRTVAPAVTTGAARELASAANAMARPLALTVPGAVEDEEPIILGSDTIASWISFGATDEAGYALIADEAAAADAIAALAGEVDQEPVNARITVAAGGGLAGVEPGQDGRALDIEASAAALLATLRERASGLASMGLVVEVTQPAVTTAHAEALLPRMEVIGSWTTKYVPGEGNFWGNNINIPVRDIDGRNLYPGEEFSFWNSIGPVTEERGYGYGGAIIDGRSTQGLAIGGGICSASTTIFNAALWAGLEILERHQHDYYIDRYPDGLDATVSIIDDAVTDMRFRNDTDNPVVIRGFGGNGFVTVEIWGVRERMVVIGDPVTSNYGTAVETIEINPQLAPGTSKRVEYPHDGHDVSRTRFVYDAAGNLIHRDEFFSSYSTTDGITQVGP